MSTAAAKACDRRRFIDISEAELGALIQRIEDAITFNLALNPDDYRLLISALGTLATMQDQLSRDDLTLRKLRKLLGMINASEKLKNLQGGDGGAKDKAGADDQGRSRRGRRRPRSAPAQTKTTTQTTASPAGGTGKRTPLFRLDEQGRSMPGLYTRQGL